ncbi:DnaJ domain-containing protein [Baffinella frigidus]|nr:DnaJ domain-containing protein [Cryptophyta sp. CCMP2293]
MVSRGGCDREITPSPRGQDEIKKAWRKAALRLHPDRNPGDAQVCKPRGFNMVKDAYDILSDPEKRDFYDKHGEVSCSKS